MKIPKLKTIFRNLRTYPETRFILRNYPCVKKVHLKGDKEYGRFIRDGLKGMEEEFGVNLQELTPIVITKTDKPLEGWFNATLDTDPPSLVANLDKSLKKIMALLKQRNINVDVRPQSILMHEWIHIEHLQKLFKEGYIDHAVNFKQFYEKKTAELVGRFGLNRVQKLLDKARKIVSRRAAQLASSNGKKSDNWDLNEFVAEFATKIGNLATKEKRQAFLKKNDDLYQLYKDCSGPELKRIFHDI